MRLFCHACGSTVSAAAEDGSNTPTSQQPVCPLCSSDFAEVVSLPEVGVRQSFFQKTGSSSVSCCSACMHDHARVYACALLCLLCVSLFRSVCLVSPSKLPRLPTGAGAPATAVLCCWDSSAHPPASAHPCQRGRNRRAAGRERTPAAPQQPFTHTPLQDRLRSFCRGALWSVCCLLLQHMHPHGYSHVSRRAHVHLHRLDVLDWSANTQNLRGHPCMYVLTAAYVVDTAARGLAFGTELCCYNLALHQPSHAAGACHHHVHDSRHAAQQPPPWWRWRCCSWQHAHHDAHHAHGHCNDGPGRVSVVIDLNSYSLSRSRSLTPARLYYVCMMVRRSSSHVQLYKWHKTCPELERAVLLS